MSTISQTGKTSMEPKHTNSTDPDLREQVSAIRSDMQALKADTAAAASTVGHKLHEEAEHAMELAKVGGVKAQEFHRAFQSTVKKHPTTAVLVTLGVGAMVGRLLARR